MTPTECGCEAESVTQNARVVIIGGGIMGVSTLYHLAKLGWTDSVLVEKTDLTHGSTWHAAGICTHFAHNPTVMEIRAESVRLYRTELEKETGLNTGFRGTGAVRVTRSLDRMDEFRHMQGLAKFMGTSFRIISLDELKEIHPLVKTGDGLVGGVYEPNDGNVDPSQATQALAAGARARGARIFRNSRVSGIECTSNGEWRVITPENEFVCEHIVNAAGTWCREIGDMMGIDLPVVPMLHQYLVTDRIQAIADLERSLPILRDPEESWYTRQERDGLICGPYEKAAQPWSVDGVPPGFAADLLPPDFDRVAHIVEMAMKRLPVLHDAGIKTIVNGPITFTPDANPLVGPAFGLQNAWLVTGSSMGIMEGGGAGKFLAEWMIGDEPPMDPIAIDPRRFGGYADRDYRVAKASECFELQFGLHYPREERPAARGVLKSAIYRSQQAVGAVFGTVYGWERANWFQTENSGAETVDSFRRTNWFEPVAQECHRVAGGAGISDLSAIAKFEVSGVDAERFMENLGSNRPPRSIGRTALNHVLSESGGVLSEFLVAQIAEDQYYLTSAATAARRDYDLLRCRASGLKVDILPVTADRGVIGLMGPRSAEIMAELTEYDLSCEVFPWLSSRKISLADTEILAIRVSYVGECGWELHIPKSKVSEVLDALIKTGSRFNLGYFGAFAMDAMRLEKGYRAWGMDLTTERTPLEAGLDHLVHAETRSFIGRDALLRRQDSPDRWRMELLEVASSDSDPFYSHPVFQGDRVIGIVTSGAYGHRTHKALVLAYLTDGANPDNEGLEVEITGVRYNASVFAEIPYDPLNFRLRSD